MRRLWTVAGGLVNARVESRSFYSRSREKTYAFFSVRQWGSTVRSVGVDLNRGAT